MTKPEALSRMDAIDHAADPAQYINYLDRISGSESMKRSKQHTFAHVLDVDSSEMLIGQARERSQAGRFFTGGMSLILTGRKP